MDYCQKKVSFFIIFCLFLQSYRLFHTGLLGLTGALCFAKRNHTKMISFLSNQMPRKKYKKIIIPFIIFFLSVSPMAAQSFDSDTWRLKSQIGLWFGPVTPIPGSALSNVLDTNIGGGIFFRANIPTNDWLLEVGGSYSYYNSKTAALLHMAPVYGAMNYRLPINLPITIFAKLGAGGAYVKSMPDDKENWHPGALAALEGSFPAGKWVNIGIRLDYWFLYEKHVKPPPNISNYTVVNAHLLNFGLMVNFNLTR